MQKKIQIYYHTTIGHEKVLDSHFVSFLIILSISLRVQHCDNCYTFPGVDEMLANILQLLMMMRIAFYLKTSSQNDKRTPLTSGVITVKE